MRIGGRLRLLAAVVSLVVLVGCGGSRAPHHHQMLTPQEALQEMLREAKAAHADESQIAILSKGEVTYADYESAMNRYFDCLRSSGYTVLIHGTKKFNGVTVIDYVLQGLPGGQGPSSREQDPTTKCYERYAEFVDGYWQANSPDAYAFEQRREKALAPALRSCLRDHQVDVPADASFVEMIALDGHLSMRTKFSCMMAIGYQDWQG
ncbi:MAG: hypothetical protein IRZ02_01410 [Acidothermus sp.]|nr:hypothetical protein [Acidothermus sp.]